MRRKIVFLLIILIITTLLFTLVPETFAYVSTPVQSGSLYDEVWSPGYLCANYGTAARYDAKGGKIITLISFQASCLTLTLVALFFFITSRISR